RLLAGRRCPGGAGSCAYAGTDRRAFTAARDAADDRAERSATTDLRRIALGVRLALHDERLGGHIHHLRTVANGVYRELQLTRVAEPSRRSRPQHAAIDLGAARDQDHTARIGDIIGDGSGKTIALGRRLAAQTFGYADLNLRSHGHEARIRGRPR